MIDEYIARNARRSPDSPALRTAKGELTFGQVDVVTEHLAMRLRERGVSRGARVALAAGNSLEFVVALFATLRLGAVAVPLNTRLAPAEVAYLLADSSPMMVVVSEQYAALISEAVSDAAVIELGLPDATGALVIDGEELAASCDFPFEDEPGRGQDDPALILYTSGTTGRPKGAVLSHLAIHVNSVSVLGRLGLFDPAEWRHVGVPLFHSGGVNSLFQQLILGAPAYIAETGGFDPAAVLDDLESNEIATAFFAPTQW